MLCNLPKEGDSSEFTDHDCSLNGSSRSLYTGDYSFTSFEDQMRIARQREQRRRQQEKMNKSTSVLMNSGASTVQERLKKFQQLGRSGSGVATSTTNAEDSSSVSSSMSSLSCTEKMKARLPKEGGSEENMKPTGANIWTKKPAESKKQVVRPSAPPSVVVVGCPKKVLTIQEKLKLARERSEKNNCCHQNEFSDGMHCRVSVIPPYVPRGDDDDDSDDDTEKDDGSSDTEHDAQGSLSCLNSSFKAPLYTGDDSFTSFDVQIRIAREREQQRRKAEMQAKLGGSSSSSVKDRMKLFSRQ